MRRWSCLALLGAAVAVSCLRDGTGPGAGRRGRLALAPVFANTGAGLVDFDRVRVTVVRASGGRIALDTLIAFPAAADSVELRVTLPLAVPSERFLLYVRLITTTGDTVFRNEPYPQAIDVVAGAPSVVVEALLEYVGVGADAVAIVITTPDTLVFFGDTLNLAAQAIGADERPIPGTPIEWSSLDTLVVRVDGDLGRVVGGAQRGTARIVARLLTGPEDTVLVTTQPLPSFMQTVSGDLQQGRPGAVLPLPLRLRVTGTDGLPVRVRVQFRALASGAAVADSVVASDSGGFAETVATLGPTAGTQTFEALFPGRAGAIFTEFATLPPAVVFAGDSSGGLSSGVFRVNPDGAGRFRLDTRGSQGDVHPRWSPDRRRAAFTYDTQRIGRNELFVVAQTGDTSALLVSDTSARRPRWSPDGVHLAFECGDGFSTGQDVCVVPDVTGPMAGLDRRGEGTGKFFVTDFDPAKLDGPAAFSWNPLDPSTLVVVRDSSTAKAEPVSRLYLVSFDGRLVQPLSAWLFDPQSLLPLRIVSTLDWSADGATIAFAAQDPLAFDAVTPTGQRLYAINKDGSGLRQLTKGPALDFQPVVSPDGKQVLFFRAQGCSVDYWQVGLDGTGETQVSAEGWCDFSSGVLGHDWSPDGKDIVLVGSEPLGNISDFLIYRIPVGTTAGTYSKDRVLIGRGVDLGGFVRDMQPSWRP